MNIINVLARDLDHQGAVFCPTVQDQESDTIAWGGHPRVYLNVTKTGNAQCPYCGNVFRLVKRITTPVDDVREQWS